MSINQALPLRGEVKNKISMATIKERMDALKAEYLETSSRSRRDEINAEIAALAKESPQEAGNAFAEQLDETVSRLRTERVRDRLGEMADAINWSFIAKNYFHKSRSWLYQRLNGNLHNGKQARFSAAESAILCGALEDIAKKLNSIAIK